MRYFLVTIADEAPDDIAVTLVTALMVGGAPAGATVDDAVPVEYGSNELVQLYAVERRL